jgi:predicted nucleotidyltransferase
MRAIPSALDQHVVEEIDRRLATVASDESVRIPWAIESGSRAWGFPSPDSDYDCRFIFVRPVEHYLSLWPSRDVIETPVDKVYDVNGWDLAKTIRLIAKGNATAIEWLRSPIVYQGEVAFRDGLLALADTIVDRNSLGRHYLHVARQQRTAGATLKRFFYAIRPAVALRWLEANPSEVIPPMDLPTLLIESDLSNAIVEAARDLVALKSRTRELGSGAPPTVLDRFVGEQLERAQSLDSSALGGVTEGKKVIADEFFRSWGS